MLFLTNFKYSQLQFHLTDIISMQTSIPPHPTTLPRKINKKIVRVMSTLKKNTLRTRLKNKACTTNRTSKDHPVQIQKVRRFGENLNQQDFICSICLELFLFPFELHCGHIFCFMCLDKLSRYGSMGNSCPCCRSVIGEQYPSRCRKGQIFLSFLLSSRLSCSQRNYYLNRKAKALQQLQLRTLQLKNIKVNQKIDYKVGNTWHIGRVAKIQAVGSKTKIEVVSRSNKNVYVFASTSSHLAAFGTFTSEYIQEIQDFLDIFVSSNHFSLSYESESGNFNTLRRVINQSESVDLQSAGQPSETFPLSRSSSNLSQNSNSTMLQNPIVIEL